LLAYTPFIVIGVKQRDYWRKADGSIPQREMLPANHQPGELLD